MVLDCHPVRRFKDRFEISCRLKDLGAAHCCYASAHQAEELWFLKGPRCCAEVHNQTVGEISMMPLQLEFSCSLEQFC